MIEIVYNLSILGLILGLLGSIISYYGALQVAKWSGNSVGDFLHKNQNFGKFILLFIISLVIFLTLK